jgi:hypothetical protein
MRWFWLLLQLMWIGPVWAVDPNPAMLRLKPEDSAKARELIAQLGAINFRERDTASRELAKMGRLALPALVEGRYHPDPEVEARIRDLYPQAAMDDLRARIDTFLADTQRTYQHDIPGWTKFQLLVGDTDASRELYTEVLRDLDNRTLLLALGGVAPETRQALSIVCGPLASLGLERPPERELWRVVAMRRQQFQSRVVPQFGQNVGFKARPPKLHEMTLVMLAEIIAPEREAVLFNNFQYWTVNFFNLPDVKNLFETNDKYSQPFRQLTLAWFETRVEPNTLYSVANLAQLLKFDNPSICRFAVRAMKTYTSNPYQRSSAMAQLHRAGGKAYVSAVTEVFNDQRVMLRQANIGGYDIRVADFALATAIMMTDQKPEDYGFGIANPKNPDSRFGYSNFFFKTEGDKTDEMKRFAAMTKWKAYESSNLASALGGPLAYAVVDAKYPLVEPKPAPPKPKVDPKDDDD